jgi:hypothetical protein
MRQENLPIQAATGVPSKAIASQQLLYCSAQCTGVSSGTLVIQASNDHLFSPTLAPTNWATIATVTITGAGSFMIPTTQIAYEYIRVLYTGAGTATVNLVAQGQ